MGRAKDGGGNEAVVGAICGERLDRARMLHVQVAFWGEVVFGVHHLVDRQTQITSKLLGNIKVGYLAMFLLKYIAALWFLIVPIAARAEPIKNVLEQVDLELVLAVDVSGSVSKEMIVQQQTAFASAFRNPDLQRAILSGPNQKIAVVYFEYSSVDKQRVVVPWMTLTGANDIEQFAGLLENAPPSHLSGDTSISGAMLHARKLVKENVYHSYRKVVDITGNGRNNDGPPLDVALQSLRSLDVIVNGLVLPEFKSGRTNPYAALFTRSDLLLYDYFETEVIGGPGAFAIEVDPKEGYLDAILRKLVLEVAWSSNAELKP